MAKCKINILTLEATQASQLKFMLIKMQSLSYLILEMLYWIRVQTHSLSHLPHQNQMKKS